MAKTQVLQHPPDGSGDVVLIRHAGTDTGYRLAREFLQSGRRVVVTSRYTTDLTRILHGYGADQVLALAADLDEARQREEVLARAATRLGQVAMVVDGRTGRPDTQWPQRFHLSSPPNLEHSRLLPEAS